MFEKKYLCKRRLLKTLTLPLIALLIYVSWPILSMFYQMTFGFYSSYKTYLDAVNDGGVQRGWIPTFVLKDAYDIIEWHDLSPEEQSLKFKYLSLENFEELIKKYKYSPRGDEDVLKAPGAKEITADDIKSIPSSVDKLTATYYRLPNFYDTACLINDKKHKTAYFFSDCIKEKPRVSP
jgi:hypothetical protein